MSGQPHILDDLLWRGLIAQSTDLGALREALDAGPVTYYCGFDPTAPSLHLGNLMQILTLRRLQDAGHRPLALVGGATGLIGDPKPTAERTLQAREVVAEWVSRIREQIEPYLDFGGTAGNAAVMVNNLDWTAELSTIDFLRDIGRHFRVNKMIAKEAVSARLHSDVGIGYTEFSYQILQGLDYLELHRRYGCSLQTGGSDQWGNLTAGLDLIHRADGASAHAFATPLLTKADGTKFGKTESGTVWLDPGLTSPYAFYQALVNAEDSKVVDYLKLLSFRSREELEDLEKAVAERPAAREAQRALADELTGRVHGERERDNVVAASQALFGRGSLAELDAATLGAALAELPRVSLPRGELPPLVQLLADTGLSPSRSAARRAVAEGGAYLNNARVTDEAYVPAAADLLGDRWLVLRRGKRNLAAVEVVGGVRLVTLADGTVRRLDDRLAQAQAASRLPSVTAGLLRDGRLVWSGGAGLVDGSPPGADVQYRAGSITKTFVAALVLRLRDEGRLDLVDRLDQHLPGTGVGQASIAQLLSHTSGLGAETGGPWWERTPGRAFPDLLVDAAGPGNVLARPGRRFHYSNVGFALLGEVVARQRGAPWAEVVREELLEPLGLRRTTTRPQAPHATGYAVHPFADAVLVEPEHDAVAMAPAGQLWSTVSDLARWGAFLAGGPPEPGPAPLVSGTLAEMREPLAVMDEPGQGWGTAFGLGLQLWNDDGRRCFGHGGSMPGFLAVLRLAMPATGPRASLDRAEPPDTDGVVVLANTTAGLDLTLAHDLLALLAELEPVPRPPWTPSGTDPGVLDLLGTWFWGPAAFLLRAGADGDLELAALGPGRASRFVPSGSDTWTGLDGYYQGETLVVRRDPAGEVRHLDLASFVLTRSPYPPDGGVPGAVDPAGWGPAGR